MENQEKASGKLTEEKENDSVNKITQYTMKNFSLISKIIILISGLLIAYSTYQYLIITKYLDVEYVKLQYDEMPSLYKLLEKGEIEGEIAQERNIYGEVIKKPTIYFITQKEILISNYSYIEKYGLYCYKDTINSYTKDIIYQIKINQECQKRWITEDRVKEKNIEILRQMKSNKDQIEKLKNSWLAKSTFWIKYTILDNIWIESLILYIILNLALITWIEFLVWNWLKNEKIIPLLHLISDSIKDNLFAKILIWIAVIIFLINLWQLWWMNKEAIIFYVWLNLIGTGLILVLNIINAIHILIDIIKIEYKNAWIKFALGFTSFIIVILCFATVAQYV